VPHNLISAQENPVPFSKFPDAPRLKILIPSESKKKRHADILIFFLKNPQQKNPLQVPQLGPYGERSPFRWHLYISEKLHKKEAPLHVTPKRGPYESR
jgi:hypothetical protein